MQQRYYRITKVLKEGPVSGATICLCKDAAGNTYALKRYKKANMRVSVNEEVGNHHALRQFWGNHLPAIIDWGEDEVPWVVMEAIECPNLLQAIDQQQPGSQAVVSDIFDALLAMWSQTKSANQPISRDPNERADRVADSLKPMFAGLEVHSDDCIIVNGRPLGALSSLLPKMYNDGETTFSVFCHGDPNPENFLVKEGKWWAIDYDRVGLHDWRLSFSHFMGWWESNASHVVGKPTLKRLAKNVVELEYQTRLPKLACHIRCMSENFADRTGRELKDPQWKENMDRYVGTFLLGETRFLEQRGRQDFLLPLIGRGLELLAN